MSIIDFVKWDGKNTDLVWKFPSEQLSTWTQLIVNESQEVILVKSGNYIGPLLAGKHTLDTINIPLLTSIIGIPFGGRSPFTAEVWFVNKSINLGVKWGTADPIQIEDPKYNTILPVRAYGQYGIFIKNSLQFLKNIIGTTAFATTNDINNQIRAILISKLKAALARSIRSTETSIFDTNTKLDQLSRSTEKIINEELSTFGFEIVSFSISSISVPEDDHAVITLKKALAKKAEMGIIGYTYQQEKSFEVLNSAASNEGTSSTIMGAGLGLGLGAGLGAPISQAFSQTSQNIINPSAITAQNNPVDKISMLKELAQLRDSGILSNEEFQEEKRKILDL